MIITQCNYHTVDIYCSQLLVAYCVHAQVQGTNDSSIGSKFSMSRLGYFTDDFVQYFTDKQCRRSPIINRCTAANVEFIVAVDFYAA